MTTDEAIRFFINNLLLILNNVLGYECYSGVGVGRLGQLCSLLSSSLNFDAS